MGVAGRGFATGFLAILVACAATVHADEKIELPTPGEVESGFAPGQSLSGQQLYERFLENRRRLRTVSQRGRVLSTDPGGNPQQVDFWLQARDYRDAGDDAVNDIFSKVMLRFVGPNELEHTAYLYIHRDRAEDDQFMYSPHRDRTMRVSFRGQGIAGSDFAFDDFLVNLDDLDDARYERRPDETIDGVSVYVVEAEMLPSAKTSYSRNVQYFEKEHYVPLKTRYWDESGVESKLLTAPYHSIREFGGLWLATEIHVRDLLEQTSSTLHIDEVDPDPDLSDEDFAISRLPARP